ncbi:bifunctional 2-keto-4-hydroxyglutarate aldolase/2-keto-3-deoxy-6-phosphogluconate aldolase [Moorella sp. E308F]|jgi:2-dehydro-3-deoxyphosphogluconate aldolase/(4S)-4-hydroxy-2-oxoglutarate aldolase|uniref:bifunctional 4-hydroxy-2-oxoglutarate aldolase/2-dehydro-3-deoxy-phosphogluconate aldolase n=1 Tax=unclassified Neomoorella TaxID=2676739 RepID=UPI0010FFB972|nr:MULTISPECIES: bifunctional 4-hydroxy-2-oxoglutarate aldolase/2-dehydro-3-deoxy-phosphogluconate aldolase [unclassified Moorella (in: firmicutes)]GEA16032.1 bifunctional 2-keto-4-hydroxyglutarate aldolase/2-keto-3-deoxy-6-phosphogluconate aldolase [Moorella sp. E308F]GEA19125.1 bifunctional 2-keto-4-hydroxyglutarate aldolase/2-keto-3-deoxy-6-phosphogluconate aldolase [Moorella sp. E306M]
MQKLKIMQRIIDCGIVAVVRAENPDQALKIAEAVKAGGVEAIEITLTVPGALEVIRELAATYRQGEILIGAGTVLDATTARLAILAGAEFLVSPSLDLEMVKTCNRYQKVCMAGAMSIREIVEVMEAGSDFVKLFPGSAFGPEMVKAIKGPLPQAPIIPTGGVSLENVGQWIKAGCEAVGVGGELTKGAKTGDYQQVEETARKFVASIRAARGQ